MEVQAPRSHQSRSGCSPLSPALKASLARPVWKGWQVAADYINANGGILGRQIELISADTGGDAVDAVPALRKLINIDQVDPILGPTSIEAQAVLPILQQS